MATSLVNPVKIDQHYQMNIMPDTYRTRTRICIKYIPVICQVYIHVVSLPGVYHVFNNGFVWYQSLTLTDMSYGRVRDWYRTNPLLKTWNILLHARYRNHMYINQQYTRYIPDIRHLNCIYPIYSWFKPSV